jgi:hypothetical protein
MKNPDNIARKIAQKSHFYALNLTETEMVSIFCVSDITGMFGN